MNILTIAGRIAGDGELRFTSNSKAVLGFSVVTDVGYGDKKHALFVRCSLWGKRAESLDAYVKKGTPVTVSGECDLRKWESNGKAGTSLELNVSDIQLQGSRKESKQEPSTGFRDKPESDSSGFEDGTIPF